MSQKREPWEIKAKLDDDLRFCVIRFLADVVPVAKDMKFYASHIGNCHQCGKSYLKPKHGTKSQYCCRACGQKAYRKRKKLETKE